MADTWFFFFSFIPFLQFIPCFSMYGKLQRKKWLFMGFLYIFIIIAYFFVGLIVDSWYRGANLPYPDDGPYEADYQDFTLDEYTVNGEVDWDAYDAAVAEFKKTAAYEKYQDDLDAWMKSPAYVEMETHNNRMYAIRSGVNAGREFFLGISFLLYWIIVFFVERYAYLRELDQQKKRQTVKRALDIMEQETIATPNEFANVPNPAPISHTSAAKINVNTATEKELEALPLVSVLDVKKIISYREEHGRFESADEFFESFQAKPHVYVKLGEMIEISQAEPKETEKKENPPKRRFDI